MSEFSISGSNLSDVSRLLRQKPGVQSKDEFLNSAFMIKDKDKSKSLVMTPEEKAAYDKYQEERVAAFQNLSEEDKAEYKRLYSNRKMYGCSQCDANPEIEEWNKKHPELTIKQFKLLDIFYKGKTWISSDGYYIVDKTQDGKGMVPEERKLMQKEAYERLSDEDKEEFDSLKKEISDNLSCDKCLKKKIKEWNKKHPELTINFVSRSKKQSHIKISPQIAKDVKFPKDISEYFRTTTNDN